MSADQDIANAIAEIIRPLGITPSTTLTAEALTSAQSAFIDPAQTANYRKGGVFCFWDGTREVAAISNVNGTTGEISFTAPLTQDHADNALVGTNLMVEAPVQIGPMIAVGPTIFVYATRVTSNIDGQRRVMGPMTVRVQHHTALLQDEDAPVDPNLWALAQQATARTNLDAIQAVLLDSWSLNASNGPNARGLGEAGRNVFETSFDHMALSDDSMQFVAVLDVIVRPLGGTIG